MSASERPRGESVTSLAKTVASSVRSARPTPSTLKAVVTAPPWARDEPPSPTDHGPSLLSPSDATVHRPSDASASTSRTVSGARPESPNSHWRAFATRSGQSPPPPPEPAPQRKPFSLRSKSWMIPPMRRSQEGGGAAEAMKEKEKETDGVEPAPGPSARRDSLRLQIPLPPPPDKPFTLAHNQTPGWQSPWSARPRGQDDYAGFGELYPSGSSSDHESQTQENLSPWRRRGRLFRKFLLTNSYVPLLFRIINVAFTAAALAMSVRIRVVEQRAHVTGAVGSSPTLVIIFAPLTLIHVMWAIYLEYFSRPLGLWRTSVKLAYTLFEVVFVCAWSAALSLCFDNFYTSLIPCASASHIGWYNELQRGKLSADLPRATGERICDDQLSLICLVGIGLLMYCCNLVISLFRIFEKVKVRSSAWNR